MINDFSEEIEKFERHFESRAERLQAQINEIFCILPQSKRSRRINEARRDIIGTGGPLSILD